MTSRDFAYWLQGFFEIANPKELNEKQLQLIKQHLHMVFIHEIDPSFPQEQQSRLDEVHQVSEEVDAPYFRRAKC